MKMNTPIFTTTFFNEGFTPEDSDTKELYNEVGSFAKQGQPIVIFGPTGAGKEFLARHYYNIFVTTEFYNQYKENWPSYYIEIEKQYSAHYSGKSLDIFLNSLRAGIFQSINSATIYPNLAESILFGHEENAFNEAITNPGLLESIKYGVLFMDEIGELPESLQAKFLRAFDSEIREGRRIAGKIDYSLKDLIIISATNRPRDMLRNDFYYKIGFDVEIKGIDERPKDVINAIPYFIRKAIGKRKDYSAIQKIFGINDLPNSLKLSETEEVNNFAQEQSTIVSNEILMRKWPGNFRALRIALEASILRIESLNNLNNFAHKFQSNLHHYISKYSVDVRNTSILLQKSFHDTIYPSPNPNMDGEILEKFTDNNILTNADDFEKKVLAVFLSSTYKTGFKRKDLGKFYKKYDAIKHSSESHIRDKINQLIALKILNKTGKSKGIRYQLTQNFLDKVVSKEAYIFALPKINEVWIKRDIEIDIFNKALLTTERIYVQAPPRYGKSAFIAMFCDSRKSLYNFYYYPLGEGGIRRLFEDVLMLLQSKKINVNFNGSKDRALDNFHPHLAKLFVPSKSYKPILIIDNVHFVSDADDKRILLELSETWKEIILILIGNKMDNIFLNDFYEFNLHPWGKQT